MDSDTIKFKSYNANNNLDIELYCTNKLQDGNTPLLHWVKRGKLEIIQELIHAGADANAKDKVMPHLINVQNPNKNIIIALFI